MSNGCLCPPPAPGTVTAVPKQQYACSCHFSFLLSINKCGPRISQCPHYDSFDQLPLFLHYHVTNCHHQHNTQDLVCHCHSSSWFIHSCMSSLFPLQQPGRNCNKLTRFSLFSSTVSSVSLPRFVFLFL